MSIISKTSQVNLNPTQLLTTAQELKQSLQSIQPDNSKTSQTITFALVAVAMMGVFVYHYIKSHEELCSQGVLINSAKSPEPSQSLTQNNLC